MKKLRIKFNKKNFVSLVIAILIFLASTCLASATYYFAYFLPKQQNQTLLIKTQTLELEKQILLDEIFKLKASTDTQNEPVPSLPSPPITEPIYQKESGCDQAKLDTFKNMALSMNYNQEEIDSFIEMAKANNCKINPSSATDGINTKLDEIQNCQKYGICY